MFEVDTNLKLLPISILDMYNVFEHIDVQSRGIQYHPYIDTHPTSWLSFWSSGSLVESKNDVIM